MPNYFLDTEFIENGTTIDLISIGIVCDDGRELYAQLNSANFKEANDFVARNVLPSLSHFDLSTRHRSCRASAEPHEAVSTGALHRTMCGDRACPWRTKRDLEADLLIFTDPSLHGKPQFWGYYADYDWVAICQVFGTMMDLPKSWPKYCLDLKQFCVFLGDPRLPEQGKGEHHALADARWNQVAYNFLKELEHSTYA